MALDGIYLHALLCELKARLIGARLVKIREPEQSELLLSFKGIGKEEQLYISSNAGLPVLYLCDDKKESPMEAPLFLMVLRKHFSNARLTDISQPGLERVLSFEFEHLNEMGDLKRTRLIAEFMGKYSNIILVDEGDTIIDAIRRVTPVMSSVRTVMPGLPYFLPKQEGKADLLCESTEGFKERVDVQMTYAENLYKSYTGISASSASEWLIHCGLDPDGRPCADENARNAFVKALKALRETVEKGDFNPSLVYMNGKPAAFSALPMESYRNTEGATSRLFSSPSELLYHFYSKKARVQAMESRSQELRKLVKNLIAREARKLDLYEKQLKESEGKDRFRLYGELLTSFSYVLPVGEKIVTAANYYDEDRPLVIPTDPDLSIKDNAQRYFEKYAKLKRTEEALLKQQKETRDALYHLESISLSLDFSESEADLLAIRKELHEAGYVKRDQKTINLRNTVKKPRHFLTSDGFHVYVGRNNAQNDELTFRFAKGNDLFFHVKKAPGSHVILVTEGREVPDRSYEEAASLAVFFSTKRDDLKAEVDYVEKKQVKKPAGAAPGFVVYYTNYSLMAGSDISSLTELD